MDLSKNHNIFKSISSINQISQPLVDDSNFISFLNYATIYDNQKVRVLTAKKDWAKHFYLKYYDISNNHKKRLNQGWNYWKRNTNQNITEIMEDARENFNIAARIELVTRDEANKCYHLFSFYSDRKHEDRAYYFYDVHRGKLLKFISYFQKAAAKLIKKANQPNNLITIPGYSVKDIHNPMRDYTEELRRENAGTELSSRTFEILCLYAFGYTKDQIADLLNKSTDNIRSFIFKLYRDHGFKSRLDMRKYLIANGYDNLDGFFLGSYPIYINGAGPLADIR